MKHETMRERLALDLYDELDAAAKAELQQHLLACVDCREYAAELKAGLGAMPRGAPNCALPAGWVERLALEVEHVPVRAALPPTVPLLAAAVGFAACALVMAALGWGPPRTPGQTGQQGELVGLNADFGRATPPPAAQTLGVVGRWGSRR